MWRNLHAPLRIGQSFYPQYHGTSAELQQNIIESTKAYRRPFMVAETGYNKTGGDGLMTKGPYFKWPGTPDGHGNSCLIW